jgi:hypothetical protein
MKKQSFVWVGIAIIVISSLSEAALSILKKDQWSNYTQSWETKWPTKVKAVAKNKKIAITICSDKK